MGTQQLHFMLNLAYKWPIHLNATKAYNGKYKIPRGNQRPGFILSLIERDFVRKDKNGDYTLTNDGWEFIVDPNPKWLYKAAYREWFNSVRPQLHRHILPPGGLSEVIKT